MSDPALSLLVVEDDATLREVVTEELRATGHAVSEAAGVAEAVERLGEAEFDVALLDLQLPDGNGIDVLRRVREDELRTECIVMTGYAEVASAIEAMKLGAYDYLTKPAGIEELRVLIERAGEKARLRAENESLRARLRQADAAPGIVTQDPGMKKLLRTLERAAASELPILIQGETGTGKELIARAAHSTSPRARGPFVPINCAAVPETIIESELFGHERGAFTGAVDRKPGLFEVAARGIVFLDEVGDLPGSVQAKLLRVLETGEFFRVGGTRVIKADVRVVSASNKELLEEIEHKRFREDLYYRLNGVTISLPPLRERRGDITLLARHFLDRFRSPKMLSGRALAALERYHWPGNVRELEMVIRRAQFLTTGADIEPDDLPLQGPARRGPAGFPTDLTLAEMEMRYIEAVLASHDGHRGKTARSLGIDPKTLYNRLASRRA